MDEVIETHLDKEDPTAKTAHLGERRKRAMTIAGRLKRTPHPDYVAHEKKFAKLSDAQWEELFRKQGEKAAAKKAKLEEMRELRKAKRAQASAEKREKALSKKREAQA